ncbi:MAG: hypothetical protein L0220_09240 [Acidobacteria bacterium]|nr:hypothetical protein [Acidobacteriota bacterium]
MNNPQALKLQLVEVILNLPDDKLQKVSDFMKSLLTQNGSGTEGVEYPPGRDPLLDYIGGLSHGSLSANIDNELYGEMK